MLGKGMTTWTVRYQYQLLDQPKLGEVHTEDVEADFCNIFNSHLVFEKHGRMIVRAFAPGRWIDVCFVKEEHVKVKQPSQPQEQLETP